MGVAPRIINGDVDASFQHFPYVGFIDWSGTSTCTGSLVGAGFVLTAAHCFVDAADGRVAAAGEVRVWMYDAWYPAAAVTVHPDYITRELVDPAAQSNDVAMVQLSSWPPSVAPVALPTTAQLTEGQTVWAAGYGLTEQGVASEVPRYTDLTVLPDSATMAQFTDEFVAGGTSGYTCSGDSGGPVVVSSEGSHTLVGLTTRGPEVCTVSFSFYVDVMEHMEQIAAWMEGDSGNSTGIDEGSDTSEGSAILEDSSIEEGSTIVQDSTSEGSTSTSEGGVPSDPGAIEMVEGVVDQFICSLFGC